MVRSRVRFIIVRRTFAKQTGISSSKEESVLKTIDVVAAIIVRDGRILATQRGYGEMKGGWEFPGGKVESGETPEQALLREIEEELGAEIAIDSHLITIDYDYESFHLHMGCYIAHVVAGTIELHEHSAARWLDASTIDDVAWLPADFEVVEAIKQRVF